MDSNITLINKMFSKTHSSKLGQWLGKETFHHPFQRKKNSWHEAQPTFSPSKIIRAALEEAWMQRPVLLFSYVKMLHFWRTHARGDRSHICHLRRSCNWWSTTGSHRRGPEMCSCCTRCPWRGKGTCRTLRRRCRISPSPLQERIREQWPPTF